MPLPGLMRPFALPRERLLKKVPFSAHATIATTVDGSANQRICKSTDLQIDGSAKRRICKTADLQNELFEIHILPPKPDPFSSAQPGESVQFDHPTQWI